MAYDKKVRDKLRAKCVQGLTLKAAAEVVGVPYNTARNWKRESAEQGDDWDVARRAKHLTSGGRAELTGHILDDLAEQFTATIQAMKDANNLTPSSRAMMLLQLSDSYAKCMAAAGRGNPKLNKQAVAMDVLRWMAEFIAKRFPKHRATFIEIAEAFGPDLAAKLEAQE